MYKEFANELFARSIGFHGVSYSKKENDEFLHKIKKTNSSPKYNFRGVVGFNTSCPACQYTRL